MKIEDALILASQAGANVRRFRFQGEISAAFSDEALVTFANLVEERSAKHNPIIRLSETDNDDPGITY